MVIMINFFNKKIDRHGYIAILEVIEKILEINQKYIEEKGIMHDEDNHMHISEKDICLGMRNIKSVFSKVTGNKWDDFASLKYNRISQITIGELAYFLNELGLKIKIDIEFKK